MIFRLASRLRTQYIVTVRVFVPTNNHNGRMMTARNGQTITFNAAQIKFSAVIISASRNIYTLD